MEDKIQKLTEKIYKEGIEKAEKEASEIIQNAQEEALKILQDAKQKAINIESDATKSAKELHINTITEIQLASEQSLKILKQKIADLISIEAYNHPVAQVLKDEDFIKELIIKTVEQWKYITESKEGLNLELSSHLQGETKVYLKNKLSLLFNNSIKVELNDKLNSGFTIGPNNGNYKISFTDQDFMAYFNQLLRPKTIELLYGNNK